jgi:hypothetical protein
MRHYFRFAEFRASDAVGTGRNLFVRQEWGFVNLDVRSKMYLLSSKVFTHAFYVPFCGLNV